jgi:hypothetical protein
MRRGLSTPPLGLSLDRKEFDGSPDNLERPVSVATDQTVRAGYDGLAGQVAEVLSGHLLDDNPPTIGDGVYAVEGVLPGGL